MKVDAEDFRRVYESMNDHALLAVKRDELVELAQQCYDVEVGRRGLAGQEGAGAADPDASNSETAGESEETVEISRFTDLDDARMAQALLKAAEIPCYLENADPVLGGFRLSVPPSWLDQAREVLDTQVSDEELAAQAEAAGDLEGDEEETREQ